MLPGQECPVVLTDSSFGFSHGHDRLMQWQDPPFFVFKFVLVFPTIIMDPFSSSIRFFHETVSVSVLRSHRLAMAESGSFVFKADPFRLKPAVIP